MAEPTPAAPGTGWIEVIVGSMYSGKTEELIRRLRRAQIARQRVEIFKPAIDDRYARDADRLAQRAAHPLALGRGRAREILQLRARGAGHRHRRGPVPRPRAGARCASSSRARASASSSPGSTRTTAGGRSSPCRSCSRSPSTSPRRSPSAWCAARRPTAPIARSRRGGPRGRGRRRPLRGALPPLLRAGAARVRRLRAARTPPTGGDP